MKIKEFFLQNYYYILIFAFFYTINFLSPPIFDDWEVSFWYRGNLLLIITPGMYGLWLSMNGRLITNILMIFFTYFHHIWDIVSALIFTFIAFFYNHRFSKESKKITLPLTLLVFTSVSDGIRTEAYSYISAHVAFIFGFALSILFYILTEKKINKSSRLNSILIILLAFILGCWVENLSLSLVVCLFAANACAYVKSKKINKILLFSLIAAILGLIIMLSSPGMHISRQVYIETLGWLDTIKISFIQNINLIVYQNKIIFLLLSLSTIVMILTNAISIKNLLIKNLYFIFLVACIFVLATSIFHIYLPFGINKLNHIISYLFTPRILTSSFWFIFLLSFIYPVLLLKKHRYLAVMTYIYSVFAILPLFFISQIADRIIAVPVLSFAILSVVFMSQVKIKKIFFMNFVYYLIVVAVTLKMLDWLFIYSSVYQTQQIRDRIINNAVIYQATNKWNYDEDVLVLPKFKANYVLNDGEVKIGKFHYQPFLSYYHLNKNTKVIFE